MLYWGNRTKDDLYGGHGRKVQQEHDNFTFIRYCRRHCQPTTGAETGLVPSGRAGGFDSLAGYQVYACGTPAMVKPPQGFHYAAQPFRSGFFSDAFTVSPREPSLEFFTALILRPMFQE